MIPYGQGDEALRAPRATSTLPTAVARKGYYDVPLLKEPVWIPTVPLYFWVGGAAGAAATLATVAQWLGGRSLAPLARRARLVAAVGDSVGAALLVTDLGRPARFHHMLRVFNPRSPMSVGSWVLAASGAANTGAWLLSERAGFLGAVGGLAGAVGGLLGMPMAGYTAVLLANSAVPVWREGRRSLPLLFMASGVAAAGSLLSLTAGRAGARGSRRERRVAHRFALAGKVGELAATALLHAEVGRASPAAAEPLRHGLSGTLLTAATALTAASVIGSLVRPRARRTSALLGALGSLTMRFAIHYAGKRSARATPRAQPARAAAATVAVPAPMHTNEACASPDASLP